MGKYSFAGGKWLADTKTNTKMKFYTSVNVKLKPASYEKGKI